MIHLNNRYTSPCPCLGPLLSSFRGKDLNRISENSNILRFLIIFWRPLQKYWNKTSHERDPGWVFGGGWLRKRWESQSEGLKNEKEEKLLHFSARETRRGELKESGTKGSQRCWKKSCARRQEVRQRRRQQQRRRRRRRQQRRRRRHARTRQPNYEGRTHGWVNEYILGA